MRMIDADAFREWWLENGENEYIYDTNAFLDSIDDWPTLTPLNEWVRVEERLPEEDPHIKKFIDGEIFGLLTVLVYNGEVKQTNRFFCNVPKFGFPKTDGWEWASSNVTHWMPLPAPPTKED